MQNAGQKKRKFVKKTDVIIIGLLLLCAGLFMFFSSGREQGKTAQVTVNGTVVLTIDFSTITGQEIYDIDCQPSLQVLATSQGVQVINAHCTDKVCQNTGVISRGGEMAVCLPARAVLKVLGKSGLDAVAG